MPTWGELKTFTWEELSYLKWADISENKVNLLQRYWNNEIALTPVLENKLKDLCQPFVDEFQKQYGKSIDFIDFLKNATAFFQVLREFRTLYKEFAPIFLECLNKVLDLLSSHFS